MSPTLPPDPRLRALQLHAEQSLSPATLARLRRARHAPDPAQQRYRPMRWLPAAFAGLALVAVGVHLQMAPSPAAPVAPVAAALEADDGGLDENPDLYLWLAGTDLAME